ERVHRQVVGICGDAVRVVRDREAGQEPLRAKAAAGGVGDQAARDQVLVAMLRGDDIHGAVQTMHELRQARALAHQLSSRTIGVTWGGEGTQGASLSGRGRAAPPPVGPAPAASGPPEDWGPRNPQERAYGRPKLTRVLAKQWQ